MQLGEQYHPTVSCCGQPMDKQKDERGEYYVCRICGQIL